MGRRADFWTVTGESLDHALATYGIDDGQLRENLMAPFFASPPIERSRTSLPVSVNEV